MKFDWIKHLSTVAHSDARIEVLRSENNINEFLSNIRSRVRIARATVINVFLITVSTIIYMYARPGDTSWKNIVFISSVGIVITVISLLIFGILEITYKRRLDQATIGVVEKN